MKLIDNEVYFGFPVVSEICLIVLFFLLYTVYRLILGIIRSHELVEFFIYMTSLLYILIAIALLFMGIAEAAGYPECVLYIVLLLMPSLPVYFYIVIPLQLLTLSPFLSHEPFRKIHHIRARQPAPVVADIHPG